MREVDPTASIPDPIFKRMVRIYDGGTGSAVQRMREALAEVLPELSVQRVAPDAVPFDTLIAISAFRYALGRMTYMVDHVATWLIQNRESLSDRDKKLIVREIDEADRRAGLGMSFDRDRWMEVRAAMLVSPPTAEAR